MSIDIREVRVADLAARDKKKGWRIARPTHTVDSESVAWVAGLAEGEGSFMRKTGLYPEARFQLDMADKDVVYEARRIMGIGHISDEDKKGYRSCKLQYRWRVSAQAEVAWLMDLVYPWMGQRRKAKIDELRLIIPTWAKESV